MFFGLLGLAILSIPFWIAFLGERDAARLEQEPTPVEVPSRSRFFAEAAASPAPVRVPIEALLLQIENHVRSEHAAAESFLESPTAALLHTRTASPLVQ